MSEDEGTERTTTQSLNIKQKVPETVIHLEVDEKQWRATRKDE